MAIGYGIDFGTSTSAIIVVDDKGKTTLIADPEAAHISYTFPSSAYVDDKGRLLVGTAAERQKRLNLGAFRTQFKREFRSTVPRQLGGLSLRTDELVTALLARLRECAQDRIHARPSQVVITVPASWDEAQCERMKDAAERAGFDRATVSLLPEPVAALRYAFDRELLLTEATVLVYDLGGGTFDCVLARGNSGEGYTVVGRPGGCPDIGGIDFTTALMTKIAKGLEPPREDWLDIDPDDDAATRMHLNFRDQCENTKRVLSAQPSAWLDLPEGDPIEIDQAVLEDAIGQMLEETITACEELLRAAGLGWEDVQQVVPVGGSTRLSLIAKLLRDCASRVVKVDEPELAVALGAALHAKDLLNGIEDRVTEEEAAPAEPGAEEETATATHTTVPLPGPQPQRSPVADGTAGTAPPPPSAADLFGRKAPRPHRWDSGKISWAVLGGAVALGGLVHFGLMAYAGLGGWLDEHASSWVPSGWVAGIAGTVCLLAALFVLLLVYSYILDERPESLVTPWVTLVFLAVCGAVVWGRLDGWGDAAVPIGLLLNLAVIAYIVAVEHISNSRVGIGDAMGDTVVGLLAAGGVALFTWWSALAYGRFAAWAEPRLPEVFSTGWMGGVVGTLAAFAVVVLVLVCNVILDEELVLDGFQLWAVFLCHLSTAAAVIVGYNTTGAAGTVVAFVLANLAAALFLFASTE